MKNFMRKILERCLEAIVVQPPLYQLTTTGGTHVMIAPNMRTKELPWGKGKITYRIPNVVEQLRFHSAAKWYDEKIMQDGALRTAYAIEAIDPFIVSIEGAYATIDEVKADRGNTDALIDIALDIAGKRVPESEKKQ